MIWQQIPKLRNIKLYLKIKNSYFSTYCQNFTQITKLKPNQTLFHKPWFNLTSFFYQQILKYFNDLQNWNFSVFWLKWTQTMEIKPNQTFFHGIYSNLTPYLFLSKNIKVFQWLFQNLNFSVLWLKWTQAMEMK